MSFAVRSTIAAGLSIALWTGCAAEVSGEPTLALSASPRVIDDQGEPTELQVVASNSGGIAGAGTVTLEAEAGALSAASVTLDGEGRATTSFSCSVAQDPGCAGPVLITASWALGERVFTATVRVTVGDVPDAGGQTNNNNNNQNPDGGSQQQPSDGGGTVVTTPDGGTGFTVTASKGVLLEGVGDSVALTAEMVDGDGLPISGQELSFQTTLGGLVALGDMGSPAPSLTASTNSSGKAVVLLKDTSQATGNATVTATHTATGRTAQAVVEVARIQQISHQSTQCGGADCTVMGIKTSGFNEQAQVRFKVIDSGNRPAPGIPVDFSLIGPPNGTSVTASAVTDQDGVAITTVSAGTEIGIFTVKAVAIAGRVEAQSSSIGIRGAKASNQGFSLQCSPVNNAVYVAPVPPKLMNVSCRVSLVDRYNNPVGTGTSVYFKTEAGKLPNGVATAKYAPTGDNSNEGTANVTFSTEPPFPAQDVAPLAAAPAQFPSPRDAEPSWVSGALTRNPRDGLVTLVAYVRGEEHFFDDNRNGYRDDGLDGGITERFIDQGEVLVDSNDNGVWDPGETYIDERGAADGGPDGLWTPPNGRWDSDTTIWTEARVLYTSRNITDAPFTYLVNNPYSGPCGSGLGKGVSTYLAFHATDFNFNRPQSDATSVTVELSSTKGSALINPGAPQDGYGFGMERRLVHATTENDCLPTTPICKWKTLFYGWKGSIATVEVKGAAVDDVTPCQPGVVKATATVLGIDNWGTSSGAIE